MDEAKLRELIKKAAQKTSQEFSSEISSLTRLNDEEIDELVADGISEKDLAAVIDEVVITAGSNAQKAENIKNINNGVAALVGIVKKFI
jgi:predicted HAD superfamily Cof-like phosphohydrolase